MRRVFMIGTLIAVAAAALLVGAGGEKEAYRVDAIFDNTSGLIPGQDVKIAGARVGAVTKIELTKERKARVQMDIETGFAPFRADADCIVRPQSIIGEKFVQCDPGTPKAKPLAKDGPAPTIPIGQTHAPVDLDLVFSTLRKPYRERFRILINELGTGLAGRPQDLSDAIERANPAIQQVNRVLKIVDRDRAALGQLNERSDAVLGELAARDVQIQSFVDRANIAASAAASRRDDLSEAVRRFPPLLAELEPSAKRLAQFTRDATPVVRDVRAAAPAVRALFADLDPLTEAARPTLQKLSELSKTGRRAVRASLPVAKLLKEVSVPLPEAVSLATRAVESLRDRGGVEGLLLFVYNGTLSQARFDRFSHLLPSFQLATDCAQYATEPAPDCNSRWPGAGAGVIEPRKEEHAGAGPDRERGGTTPRKPGAPAPQAPAGPSPQAPAPKAPQLPGIKLPDLPVGGDQESPLAPDRLLDFLLGK